MKKVRLLCPFPYKAVGSRALARKPRKSFTPRRNHNFFKFSVVKKVFPKVFLSNIEWNKNILDIIHRGGMKSRCIFIKTTN